MIIKPFSLTIKSLFIALTILLSNVMISACSQHTPTQIVEVSNSANTATRTPKLTHSPDELNHSHHNPSSTKTIEKPPHLFETSAINKNTDLWSVLRRGFELQQHYHNPRVQEVIWRYAGNHDYFQHIYPRLQKYFPYIVNEAQKRGIPLEIALLPVIESSLNPYAVSNSQAKGMWQFIASTGKQYGLAANRYQEPRRDIVQSTEAGLDHLQDLYAKFDDWLLAIAAYNAGPGGIQRAVNYSLEHGGDGSYWSLDVRTETHQYVPKILALASIIDHPYAFGITLPTLDREVSFDTVQLRGSFNLSQLASCASMDLKDFLAFNTRYNRIQTRNRQHTFYIPKSQSSIFKDNIEDIKYNCNASTKQTAQGMLDELRGKRTQLLTDIESEVQTEVDATPKSNNKFTHIVQPGETLWRIAYNNKVSVSDIMQWNQLTSHQLKTGTKLILWK